MYESVYENWEKFPRCRIRIDMHGDGGENLWGKQLSNGTIGIDNHPLQEQYRWQDIVKSGSLKPQIIHRRWNAKIWYSYELSPTKLLSTRKKILELAKAQGWELKEGLYGMGFVLLQDKKDALEKVREVLNTLTSIENLTLEDGP